MHDILDFENQATVKKNRKFVINHIKDMMYDSKISREIIQGVIGRNLELEEPLQELGDFFEYSGLETSMF